MKIPNIIINGLPLTDAQAMTVHAALQHMAWDMAQKNALGDDKHGEFMRKAYLTNIAAINKISIPS
jgi:hypothetical protein